MRVARRNWILGAVLVGLLGVQAALRTGGDRERDIVPLMTALEGKSNADVARIVVEGGAPGARRTLTIERDDESAWRLTDHAGYPAHGRQVDGLIDRLRGLTTLDLLSEDPASHPDYKVDEAGTRVSLFDAGGAPLATLVQGESTGGRASYVRLADEGAVYRAPHLPQIGTAPRQWIETSLFRVRFELVESIRLSGPEFDTDVVLTRDPSRLQTWTAEDDRNVPVSVVNSLLSRAHGLFIEDTLGAFDAERFGTEQLVVTLTEQGGRTATARLGSGSEQGHSVADPGDGQWLVSVPSSNAKLLLEAARALR